MTGFSGLIYMPTRFQKAMACRLQGPEGVICDIDNLLVVSKDDIADRNVLVEVVMNRLGMNRGAHKQIKCEFSVKNFFWLDFKNVENLYSTKRSKIEATNYLNLHVYWRRYDPLWAR